MAEDRTDKSTGRVRLAPARPDVRDPQRKARNELVHWCEARGLTPPSATTDGKNGGRPPPGAPEGARSETG